MKHNLKRVLSFVLVMMLLLSCMPVMAFAAEDAHNHAAQNITTGVEYHSLAEAMADATAGQTVKVLADCDEAVAYTDGVILDLNGHNLTVTAAEGVTLSAIDSATDDYEGEYGTLITEGNVAATVKTADAKSYVSICENGSWSFHRYYAAITAISLKPATAALGYKAEFYGDETVKNAVVNYGYELWINDYAPKAVSKADKLEKNVLTLRLNNILKEDNDALNAIGSTASIHGNAFITLNRNGENITLSGTQQTTSLRDTIETINANVAAYGEAQLQSVRDFCTTYAAWMTGWATDAIFGIGDAPETGDGLKVEVVVDVTAENGVLTQDATMTNGDISVTVPQGTALNEGVTQLILTIAEKAKSDSDVEKGEGQSLIPLDVHIEGISADNTTPIIVCLGQVLPKGLNIGNYDLFHVENGETVPMTRVYTVSELDTHNEFCYDPATGSVTVAVASFSEITLRASAAKWTGEADHSWYDADATTLYIYNADQLWSLSQIVGGMMGQTRDSFAGKTIVLHADIDLNDGEEDGKIFYPIGYYNTDEHYIKNGTGVTSGFYNFEGVFDGNGHTISNFYQNTWEMKGDHNWYSAEEENYRDGMGLFGKVYGGTVKNLTVKNFSSDGEIATTGTIAAYADCGATFENITIFNCNPRVYNIGNGGIVGCVGWYAKEANTKVTFKNITVDNSNKISALWGSWDVACGGLVGQYYPTSGQSSANYPVNGGIDMINCHVAAQIDVNNDVCANYQYYAYRYAGILIGSVRENVKGEDGRIYPKMDGLSAENCTVHFGDWNDYYYCELVANSIASYTHDYQMSRLTQVDEITDEMRNGTGNYVIVTGNHATENAQCYHFVNGVEYKHESAGTEIVDGVEVLVEDKQHIYLEFNNLVTGYEWGVTSYGVDDMDGVTILDRLVADSVVKFDKDVADGTTYWTDSEVTVGDLFSVKNDIPKILAVNSENVQISISPVGATSTAGGTFTANTTDWTQGTISFTGKGAAEIIITDYYFCLETRLEVYVDGYTVRYNDPNGITTVIYGENGITELPTREAHDGKEFYGWSIAEVADKSTTATVISAGYKPANKDHFFLYAVYTYTEKTEGVTTTEYVLTNLANITADDVVVIVGNNGKNYAMSNNNSTSSAPAAVAVTIANNKITSGVADTILWNISNDNGEYTIYPNGNTSTWLYCTASNNGVRVGTNDNKLFKLHDTGYLQNKATSRYLGIYSNSDWRCYTTGSNHVNIGGQTFSFYVKQDITVGGSENTYFVSYLSECGHANKVTDTQAATCTENGCTTVICADCGATMSTVEIPATGHNYVDGVCSVCDAVKATNATITFDNTNKRTELSAAKQVWEENGITVTNTSATNNIADYSNPVRFYKNTIVVVEFPEMTKIEVVCSSESYATALQESIEGSVKNGTTVIISFAATNSYTMTMSVDQVRVNSITVYTEGGNSSVCDHIGAETTTTTTAPTCIKDGVIVVTCNNCDSQISSTTIPATGHNFVDGNCSVCGEAQVIIPEIPETGVYQLVTDINDITAGGKFVIVATVDGTYYAMGAYNTEKKAVLGEEVEISGNYVTTADAPTWIIGQYGDNIALQGSEGAYLKQSSADGAQLSDSKSEVYAWIVLETENADIFHIASSENTERGLMYRTGDAGGTYNYFRSYGLNTTTNGYYPGLKLYKLVEGEIEECEHSYVSEVTQAATCTEAGVKTYTCSKCSNSYTETIAVIDHSYNVVETAATCTEDGVMTYTCSTCSHSYTETIDALGHTTDNGICDNCGETIGAAATITKTISFTTTAQRDSLNTSQQVWSNGDLTFTNNQAGSSSAVADYSNPVRLYISSTITIKASGKIKQIVLTASSSSYLGGLTTSTKIAGVSKIEISGAKITLTLDGTVDEITYKITSKQLRLSSLEVTYES